MFNMFVDLHYSHDFAYLFSLSDILVPRTGFYCSQPIFQGGQSNTTLTFFRKIMVEIRGNILFFTLIRDFLIAI